MKVAIVHDWLIGGGAERVVHELHRMYPDAPIYTSYCIDEWRAKLDGKVVTGFLQHWPFSRLRKFIGPLRIWWFTHLKFDGYNLVISSSSSGEAKAVRVPEGTVHIDYCHAPTHFYWSRYDEYMQRPGFGLFDPLARFGLRLLVGPLRKWDYKVMQQPHYLIANSTHTQAGIKKYYNRDSVVIHPPIAINRFTAVGKERRGFVITGRQTPYKRTDLAVAACTKLSLPLYVMGNGPDHDRLVKMAGPTVTFNNHASDQDVADGFAKAQAFIFPVLDDFGVTPVEALAAGLPVIAYKAGGALDYVEEGKTGLFFEEQTVDSLAHALQSFDPKKFDERTLRQKAQGFAPAVFAQKLRSFIERTLSNN